MMGQCKDLIVSNKSQRGQAVRAVFFLSSRSKVENHYDVIKVIKYCSVQYKTEFLITFAFLFLYC